MNKIIYGYNDLKRDIPSMVSKINKMGHFDAYLVILKGGGILIPTLLRHLPFAKIYTIHAKSYNGIGTKDAVEILTECDKSFFDTPKKILIFDDVLDSGCTIREIFDLFKHNIDIEKWSKLVDVPRFFSIFKKSNQNITLPKQLISAMYEIPADVWVEFEWEQSPTV